MFRPSGHSLWGNYDDDEGYTDLTIKTKLLVHIIVKLSSKNNNDAFIFVGADFEYIFMSFFKMCIRITQPTATSDSAVILSAKKAKELGLDNQVSFELADYREVKGEYDRIYSVGMFEHVGRKFYNKFFKSINKLLKNDGLFLLHTIGVVDKPTPQNKFINKFPA